MRNTVPEITGEVPVQDVYQGALDINEAFTGRPGSAIPILPPSNELGGKEGVFRPKDNDAITNMFSGLGARQKTVGATPALPPIITPQIY